MFRKLSVVFIIIGLAGCARPTDHGQQYIDGEFESNLNQVSAIQSEQPTDFRSFKEQSQKVIDGSPSMTMRYQGLYTQLQLWADESGDLATLTSYGIDFSQMGGGDKQGNVLMTGYFSPVIDLRRTKDDVYQYPLYLKPSCIDDCPTRAEIYDGALDGQGLELGYAENLIDPFIMEVQGSGFVDFGDSETFDYFSYGGKNNHPYVSIGRVLIERGEVPRKKMSLKAIKEWVEKQDDATVRELLEQNTSYVFFSPRGEAPVKGTAGIPLIGGASVAADRDLFPMGTPLLAEVPQLDEEGVWNGKWVLKLLIALDTGGAVKENHLDLYHGMGLQAGIDAGHYKHFGRVWKLGAEGTEAAATGVSLNSTSEEPIPES